MAPRWFPIVGVAGILLAPVASAQLRLEGLERLYFERLAAPGEKLPSDLNIASLMPETLRHPGPASRLSVPGVLPEDLRVRDIELTSRSSLHRIWIREIVDVDGSHPRIDWLWWGLYDGGRRSDVWTFAAMPDRTDRKILSNYHLDSVSMPKKDTAVFKVRGDMFRPGGAWWVVGKEWQFALGDNALTLTRVRNVFGLFSGYEIGEEPSPFSVTTEREDGDRYEIRDVDAPLESTLRTCRFRDPYDEDWTISWDRLLKVAQCITSKPDAKVTFRDLDSTSFIERERWWA
jgi:hypothetical protein